MSDPEPGSPASAYGYKRPHWPPTSKKVNPQIWYTAEIIDPGHFQNQNAFTHGRTVYVRQHLYGHWLVVTQGPAAHFTEAITTDQARLALRSHKTAEGYPIPASSQTDAEWAYKLSFMND